MGQILARSTLQTLAVILNAVTGSPHD